MAQTGTKTPPVQQGKGYAVSKTPAGIQTLLHVVKYIFLIVVIAFAVGPLLWAFMSSFKSYTEINSSAFSLPSQINLKNYADAFKYAPIAKFFMNSVVIVAASIVVTVIFVCMCAYAIARFQFRGKLAITLVISAALMLPAQAISQPLFSMLKAIQLFDTKAGLILVYSAMGIPTAFFVMVSFYKSIPAALEEAAYIDGAGFFRTFAQIILPLAKPGIATVVILQFINSWNEFFYALVLTSGDSARTIPIALNYYMGTFANNYSAMFAAVVMTVLPTILVFVVAQDQVVDSLAAGAVKE